MDPGRSSDGVATARTETATPRPTLALGILLTALMLCAASDAMSAATASIADDAWSHAGVVIADPPIPGADDAEATTEPAGARAANHADLDGNPDTVLPVVSPTDAVAAPKIWPLVVGGIAALLLFVVLRGWSLPRTAPTDPLSPMHLAGLAIAMLLMAPIGATIAVSLTGVRADDDALRMQGVLMLGAYSAKAIVVIAWLVMRRNSGPAPDAPPTPDSSRSTGAAHFARAVGIGALTFAVAWPIVAATVAIAGAIRLSVTGEPTEQLAHETLKALDEGSGAWRVAVALMAALAAPFFEEVLFRGMMQPALRALGAAPWTAIVLVSTLFATVHWGAVPPPALPGLLVLSLAFGWARERTGGLTAPIVAHVLFNVGNLVLAGAL